MLKITASGLDRSCRIIKLEGKLLQPWVDEVRRHFVMADGLVPGLDLSGVSFVDSPGAELLRQLVQQGVRIHSCSPFVAELLRPDRDGNS